MEVPFGAGPLLKMTSMIGRTLLHYHILEALGAGGMGEVYRARDENLHRDVAIKILPDEFIADEVKVARFQRESRLASQLSHPNIATIHEAGEVDGVHFIAMELVRGRTLAECVRPGGMSLDEILKLAIPLAQGLAEAHEFGIIHRDLKPGNVMVDQRGRVKILDFGLSIPEPESEHWTGGLTTDGRILGTPHYMSPEQVLGKETEARGDLFSVGVILYELATGSRPFQGDSMAAVLNDVLERQPTSVVQVKPHLGELFSHTVERLLEKEPKERFQSAADLVAQLKSLRKPSSVIVPVHKKRSRGPLLLGAALTLLAVAAGLFAFRSDLFPPAAAVELGVEPGPATAVATPTPPPQITRPILAIVPFSLPEGDLEASTIARTLVHSLPAALDRPELELFTARFLADRAKKKGITGTLDSDQGREIALEAGASDILIGQLERGVDGLDLFCELLDSRTGRYKTSRIISGVTSDSVSQDVEALAAAVLEPFGIEADEADLPSLSGSSDGLRFWAEGLAAYDRANWSAAQLNFEAATVADPRFAMAHYYSARSLWWLSKHEEALASVDQVLELTAVLSAADLVKAELLHELIETKSSSTAPGYVARARALAEGNPHDKDAHDLWMEHAFHHQTEGDTDEALRACERLLELDPDYGPAFIHQLDGALRIDRQDLLRPAAEGILRTESDGTQKAFALAVLGRREEAGRLLRDSPITDFTRARALQTACWLADFELVLELMGDDEVGSEQAMGALAGMGRFAQVRVQNADYLVGYALGVLPGTGFSAATRMLYAGWLARSGYVEDAEQALAAETPENDIENRLQIWATAEIALARGEVEAALAHFQNSARIDSTTTDRTWLAFLTRRAGRALLDAGRYEKAEAHFSRCLLFMNTATIVPGIRALPGLALCRAALGDREGAREHLERFLSIWPTPDWALPEIEEGLELYAEITGETWAGTFDEEPFIDQWGRRALVRDERINAINAAYSRDEFQLAYDLAALGWRDDPEALVFNKIAALSAMGRFDQIPNSNGIHAFDIGMTIAPDLIPNRLLIAAQLARSGDPRAAQRALDDIDPSELESLFLQRMTLWTRGEIAIAQGRADAALEFFLEAAPARGEFRGGYAAFLLQRAGRALREAGRFEEAERMLLKLDQQLEYPIPRVRSWFDLALCREAQGDVDGALFYLEKFLTQWSRPRVAIPEIEEALFLYEASAGKAWGR